MNKKSTPVASDEAIVTPKTIALTGWAKEVLDVTYEKFGYDQFGFKGLRSAIDWEEYHPEVKKIDSVLLANLQKLRNLGMMNFVARGSYQLVSLTPISGFRFEGAKTYKPRAGSGISLDDGLLDGIPLDVIDGAKEELASDSTESMSLEDIMANLGRTKESENIKGAKKALAKAKKISAEELEHLMPEDKIPVMRTSAKPPVSESKPSESQKKILTQMVDGLKLVHNLELNSYWLRDSVTCTLQNFPACKSIIAKGFVREESSNKREIVYGL